MPRPKCCRRIGFTPESLYFRPRGISSSDLDEIVLTLDECESVRLADLEGLYQEEAAARMNVSRQTFGRIIESAHKKVADALINAKALRIEGGNIALEEIKCDRCPRCRKEFPSTDFDEKGTACPHCRKLKHQNIKETSRSQK